MTDTPKPELKPCPFCGATRHVICAVSNTGGNLKYVACSCGADGPSKQVPDDRAIEAWNTRAPQWQPIETAPKDATRILVLRQQSNECIPLISDDYYSKKLGNVWAKSNQDTKPTHWMPLPTPPNTGGE